MFLFIPSPHQYQRPGREFHMTFIRTLMRRSRRSASTAVLLLTASLAQAQSLTTASKFPGEVHLLPATLETTQWGWFDNAQPPVLTINSGDIFRYIHISFYQLCTFLFA